MYARPSSATRNSCPGGGVHELSPVVVSVKKSDPVAGSKALVQPLVADTCFTPPGWKCFAALTSAPAVVQDETWLMRRTFAQSVVESVLVGWPRLLAAAGVSWITVQVAAIGFVHVAGNSPWR